MGTPLTDKNRLSKCRPWLCEEWLSRNNGGLTTDKVSYGSDVVVWWKCKKCEHEWETSVSNRAAGKHRSGCPACSGNVISNTNRLSSVRPDLLKEWDYKKNISMSPDKVSYGSRKKVWWKCKEHGSSYQMSLNDKARRNLGCPVCRRNSKIVSDKNRLSTLFPDVAKEWHPIKNNGVRPDCVAYGSSKKYWWLCSKCGNDYSMSCNNRTNANRYSSCYVCNIGTLSKISQEWLDSICLPKKNREVWLPELGIRADGFDPDTNTVYEFLGDFWHGNPAVYYQDEANAVSGKTFGQLFDETTSRLFLLRRSGYNLNIIWEADFMKTRRDR